VVEELEEVLDKETVGVGNFAIGVEVTAFSY
jgi:hypothetical protein